MSKLCALVIGHKSGSPGASNNNKGLTEFDFNDDLARRIEKEVSGVRIQRVYRRTYQQLPGDINELDPDFIISLHCNAFNTKASGCEMLYYHRSDRGHRMAEILQENILEQLHISDRGTRSRSVDDRGGFLLKHTKAPCVIAEPFFIDNDHDLELALRDLDGLAGAYARAIERIARKVV